MKVSLTSVEIGEHEEMHESPYAQKRNHHRKT